MSDSEMMLVDGNEDDAMPVRDKGKGRAVETANSDDNLPW
jgi:hypothetical protein